MANIGYASSVGGGKALEGEAYGYPPLTSKMARPIRYASMMWADNFWLASPWLLLPLCWSAGHVFSQSGQPRGNSEITPPCMMKGCGLVYADGWTFLPLCASDAPSRARRSWYEKRSSNKVPCPFGLVGRLPPNGERTPSGSGCVKDGRAAEGGRHGLPETSGAGSSGIGLNPRVRAALLGGSYQWCQTSCA